MSYQDTYVATITVLLDTDGGKFAPEDILSENLRAMQEGGIKDWAYTTINGVYQYPQSIRLFPGDEYEEGDFLAVLKHRQEKGEIE